MSGANIKRLMDPECSGIIMDSATDGFTYTDETGYIVYNNRAYSGEMAGLPDERSGGTTSTSLSRRVSHLADDAGGCSRAGKPARTHQVPGRLRAASPHHPSPLSTARTDGSVARWAACGT